MASKNFLCIDLCYRLFVFPNLGVSEWAAGFHIPRLLMEMEKNTDIAHEYIGSPEIHQLSKIQAKPGQNLILINWLDDFYSAKIPRYVAVVASYLPSCLQNFIANLTTRELKKLTTRLRGNGYRLIFFYHDLSTFSRISLFQKIDSLFRPLLYQESDAVIFAEESARTEIESKLGAHKNSFISVIGPYAEYHGKPRSRSECRKKLNIPDSATVLVALGTLRKNRKLTDVFNVIARFDDLYLVAGGRGHESRSTQNIQSIAGYIDNDTLLNMIGSADYLLHTGREYLTSASVRVALTYHKPVIAESFGSTSDMCKGGLLELPRDSDSQNDFFNHLPRFSSPEYFALQREIIYRDQERSWEQSAKGLLKAIE